MLQKAVERIHQFDDGDFPAVVDKVVIDVSGVCPTPRVSEGVELRLAYLPARLAKEDVVIGVRIKRRIEIDKIDTRVGKFTPIGKPFQIVAKIQPIHSGNAEHNNRFLPPSPHGYGAAGDFARNNKCKLVPTQSCEGRSPSFIYSTGQRRI